MKTITEIKNIYLFNELKAETKIKVLKEIENNILNERSDSSYVFEEVVSNILEPLNQSSYSDLKFTYDLGNCQGDGFNIYGEFDINTFIPLWNRSDEEKEIIKLCFDCLSSPSIKLLCDDRYNYSCKFLNKQEIPDIIDEIKELMSYEEDGEYENIWKEEYQDILNNFLTDMFNYFEELDIELEKIGYEYFYKVDEEEIHEKIQEYCYYEDGTIYDDIMVYNKL